MNRVALITGGSRGLGKSTALALAKNGVDVIFTYQSNEIEAEKTLNELRGLGVKAAALQLDVGQSGLFPAFKENLTARLAEQWGAGQKLDILVNNAGIGLYAPVSETSEEQFDLLMNIHLKGVFFLTQALLGLINDGGCIVNVSSGLARFCIPGYGAYAMMKGGIETLTRYLAQELGPRGIRVNVVAPGAIETDFGGGAVRDNADLNQMVASQTALGRAGLPEDIGPMIAALTGEANRWVNGQRIEVSGGQSL